MSCDTDFYFRIKTPFLYETDKLLFFKAILPVALTLSRVWDACVEPEFNLEKYIGPIITTGYSRLDAHGQSLSF